MYEFFVKMHRDGINPQRISTSQEKLSNTVVSVSFSKVRECSATNLVLRLHSFFQSGILDNWEKTEMSTKMRKLTKEYETNYRDAPVKKLSLSDNLQVEFYAFNIIVGIAFAVFLTEEIVARLSGRASTRYITWS